MQYAIENLISDRLATVLEQRQKLLSTYPEVKPPVSPPRWPKRKRGYIAMIDAERKSEEEEARARNTRFE
jgi:hypothetical protein